MRTYLALVVLLAMTSLGLGAAKANTLYTYVASNGTDSGDCIARAPCRTIQYAINRTTPFGEVHTLDAANYGPARITKSLRIIGVPGAVLGRNSAGNVVEITATVATFEMTNMIIEGGYNTSPQIDGIWSSAPGIRLKNCLIRNTRLGILIDSSASGHAMIEDTTISNARNSAVTLQSSVYPLDVAINRLSIIDAAYGGIVIGLNSLARVSNSYITYVNTDGIQLAAVNAFLQIDNSSIVANTVMVYLHRLGARIVQGTMCSSAMAQVHFSEALRC